MDGDGDLLLEGLTRNCLEVRKPEKEGYVIEQPAESPTFELGVSSEEGHISGGFQGLVHGSESASSSSQISQFVVLLDSFDGLLESEPKLQFGLIQHSSSCLLGVVGIDHVCGPHFLEVARIAGDRRKDRAGSVDLANQILLLVGGQLRKDTPGAQAKKKKEENSDVLHSDDFG